MKYFLRLNSFVNLAVALPQNSAGAHVPGGREIDPAKARGMS